MSLNSALLAAMSGLGVSARRAEVVSTNIANATTEGYAKRSLVILPGHPTAGARVSATERTVDSLILGETRLARAAVAQSETQSTLLQRLEAALGAAGEDDTLVTAIDRLDSALLAAAGAPGSDSHLAEVADAAAALADRFHRAADGLQTTRAEADRSISQDVARLNEGLSRISSLDRQIVIFSSTGRETASLLDLRQREVDAISSIVPLKEQALPDGRIRLMTSGGAILYDREPAQITFTATPVLTATGPEPHSVQVNGVPLSAEDGGVLAGGSLGAAMAIRDRIAPDLQEGLDALAADLLDRLASADSSLAPNSPGLLTDRGSAVDPTQSAGLSARLTLNPAVDVDDGGDLWRIRSGLSATSPAETGDTTLLLALQQALSSTAAPLSESAASLLDSLTQRSVDMDSATTAARASLQTLQAEGAALSVSTDAELQDLLQIEKSYAANARVLQAVDEMLSYLLAR